MHACKLLHAHKEKFYRGINYFRGGPNISEIFGPGGPNIMGVQIFRYRTIRGKGGPPMAAMDGPAGPLMATKFAIDGPAGPFVRGPSVA